MREVEVKLATAAEEAVLANLMQLYIHDFSELWWDSPAGELQSDGRFAASSFAPYWSEPGCFALLIYCAGRLAGFALVNAVSLSGEALDHNMAEFFIVRKYRRAKVGTLAAQTIFSRYKGRWETAVARRNRSALSFWREAVGGHPRVQDLTERDARTAAWDGPILRFDIGE